MKLWSKVERKWQNGLIRPFLTNRGWPILACGEFNRVDIIPNGLWVHLTWFFWSCSLSADMSLITVKCLGQPHRVGLCLYQQQKTQLFFTLNTFFRQLISLYDTLIFRPSRHYFVLHEPKGSRCFKDAALRFVHWMAKFKKFSTLISHWW